MLSPWHINVLRVHTRMCVCVGVGVGLFITLLTVDRLISLHYILDLTHSSNYYYILLFLLIIYFVGALLLELLL